MVKKILTIGLTSLIILLMAATPTLASTGNFHAYKNKYEQKSHDSDRDNSKFEKDGDKSHKEYSYKDNDKSDKKDDSRADDKRKYEKKENKKDHSNNLKCKYACEPKYKDNDKPEQPKHEKPEKPQYDKPRENDCEPKKPEKPTKPEKPAHPEKPKPELPVVPVVVAQPTSTPVVLTMTTLPVTASETDNPFGFVYGALILIIAGVAINVVAKKYERSNSST